jgi:hypothetical protein
MLDRCLKLVLGQLNVFHAHSKGRRAEELARRTVRYDDAIER